MLRTKAVKGVLGLSAAAALFATLAVQAQSGAGSAQPAAAQTAGATASGSGAPGAALSRSDRKMIMNMAQANMAEIEMGRIAHSRSQSEQVKNFAQQMIDDHTKALEDLKRLAQTRGITLPADLDRTHRARADKLGAMTGEAFDRAYMEQAGVSDHKKNHSQLRAAQAKARDPELKALAARTLPVVDQHLTSAQQLHKNTSQGRSGTQGATGSSGDRTQHQQDLDKKQEKKQDQKQDRKQEHSEEKK